MRQLVLVATAVVLWVATPPVARAQVCRDPGKERWPLKTSIKPVSAAARRGTFIDLAKLLQLPDPPGADELDHHEFDARFAPPFENALHLKEGDVIEIEGWIHLVAVEGDGDYHIQMTMSRTSGNDNVIVEVPCGVVGFMPSAGLRRRANDVRAFIRDRMLKGREPSSGGSVMNSPPYVRLRGQLFYDASHFGDAPRGKRGMKAGSIWEVHPVIAMWFVRPPG